MSRADDKGFSLIEMLIVMVVLGVLATIVIISTGVFIGDSKKSACASNAKIMNTAEAAYAAQHSGVPPQGDTTKLAAYLRDPVPTAGEGAVAWDAGSQKWTCA